MRRDLYTLALCVLSACVGSRPAPDADRAASEILQLNAMDAVHRLAQLEQARAAVPEFAPFLDHAEISVRLRATYALARVGDPAAGPQLLRALADSSEHVRAGAAFALAALDGELPLPPPDTDGDQDSEPWLREAVALRVDIERALSARLQDEQDAGVRQALYTALGQIFVGPGLGPIEAGVVGGGREAAWAALAYGVHRVRRGEQAQQSPELLAKLVELARSDDVEVRFGAVFALARSEAELACRTFALRLVKDADPRVRTWATRGLAACDNSETALFGALSDVDWRVQVEGLRALKRRRDAGAKISGKSVQIAAKTALAALASAEAGKPVAGAMHVAISALPLLENNDSIQELAREARCGWGQGTGPARVATTALCCELAVELAARTLELEPLALCAGEGAAPHEARVRQARALSRAAQANPALVSRLHALVADPDPRVRIEVVHALASADDAATRTLLRTRLVADRDAAVLEAVADTMAGWPADPTLAKELRTALARTDQVQDVALLSARTALVRALVTHGRQAAKELLATLASQGPIEVRNATLRALGQRPIFGVTPTFGPVPQVGVEGLRVRLRTTRGVIMIDLLGLEAPRTVANFVGLARRGYYDGLVFHRVVPGFVVQAGDPRGDGYGGPGYKIPCEITPRTYTRGTVGMALAGKDTGGSQFFITHSAQPHLDGRYTAFGRLVEGGAVLDALVAGDQILGLDFVTMPTLATPSPASLPAQ